MSHDAKVEVKIGADSSEFKAAMENMVELSKKSADIMMHSFKEVASGALEGFKKLADLVGDITGQALKLAGLDFKKLSPEGIGEAMVKAAELGSKLKDSEGITGLKPDEILLFQQMFKSVGVEASAVNSALSKMQIAIAGGGEEAAAARAKLIEYKDELANLEKYSSPQLVDLTKTTSKNQYRHAQMLNEQANETDSKGNYVRPQGALMKEFGISDADLDAYKAKVQKFDESNQGLRDKISDMEDILTMSKKAFKMIGLNPEELKGKETIEAFELIIGAIAKLENHADKLKALKGILGKMGPSLAPLVDNYKEKKESAEGIVGPTAKLYKENPQLTGFSKTSAETLDNVKDKWWIQMGTAFNDALSRVRGIKEILEKVANSDLWVKIGEAFGSRFAGFIQTLKAGLDKDDIWGGVALTFGKLLSLQIRGLDKDAMAIGGKMLPMQIILDDLKDLGAMLFNFAKNAALTFADIITQAIDNTALGKLVNNIGALGAQADGATKQIVGAGMTGSALMYKFSPAGIALALANLYNQDKTPTLNDRFYKGGNKLRNEGINEVNHSEDRFTPEERLKNEQMRNEALKKDNDEHLKNIQERHKPLSKDPNVQQSLDQSIYGYPNGVKPPAIDFGGGNKTHKNIPSEGDSAMNNSFDPLTNLLIAQNQILMDLLHTSKDTGRVLTGAVIA